MKPTVTLQPTIGNDNDDDTFKKVECENIVLDPSKIDLISNIMSNINLPSNFTPDWAKSIPEQIWKKNLIENINAKQTNLFDLINKNNE